NFYYKNSKLYGFVKYIGKWSMADVFVVAIFLGFLAFNNMQTGIQTRSHVLLGLYFFLTYCVVSIVSSSFIKRT
ncbi:MAG: paraquat-inducible protein A, partial [Bacteroidota bacterium]